jgi:hypothetical protein
MMKETGFVLFAASLLVAATQQSVLATGCLNCNETVGCFEVATGGALQCHENPCMLKLNCSDSGCFVAGTKVRTPNGDMEIQNLRVGDQVYSSNALGDLVVATVNSTHRALAVNYLLINGSTGVTSEHPFRAGNAWVDAGQLMTGDVISRINGTSTVVSIARVERGVRVYNIEVGGTHTFFANGWLVHNKVVPGG